jgi:hypothetical protein
VDTDALVRNRPVAPGGNALLVVLVIVVGQVGISSWSLPHRMKMPMLGAGVPVRGSIARWCREPEDRLTPVPGGTTICSPA